MRIKRRMRAPCLTRVMPIGTTFARLCRDSRRRLRLTQRQVAATTGVSRAYIATIESGRANPPCVWWSGSATLSGSMWTWWLGSRSSSAVRPSVISSTLDAPAMSTDDFAAQGWSTAREVEVVQGRSHGWIDVLAYDDRTEAPAHHGGEDTTRRHRRGRASTRLVRTSRIRRRPSDRLASATGRRLATAPCQRRGRSGPAGKSRAVVQVVSATGIDHGNSHRWRFRSGGSGSGVDRSGKQASSVADPRSHRRAEVTTAV